MKNRHRKWILTGFLLIFALSSVFLLSACDENLLEGVSDDGSDEAKLEEARIAIDDEDYGKAMRILEGLSQNAEVCELLGHANAGLAGIDIFALLRVVTDFIEEDEGDIAMAGLVLGGQDAALTKNEVEVKLLLTKAGINAYTTCIANPDNDQTIHMGIISMFDIALNLASMVMEQLGYTGEDAIELTKEGLERLYLNRTPDFSGIAGVQTIINDWIKPDVERVIKAAAVLAEIAGDDDDLAQSLSAFIDELDSDGNGISVEDLENYIIRNQ